MDIGLSGKVALVTGGTRGIGEAVVLKLVEKGAQVVFCGRNELQGGEVEARANLLGAGRAKFVKTDVVSLEDQERAFAEAKSRYGGVDFVFANAGWDGPSTEITTTKLDDIRHVFEVNLLGSALTQQLAIKYFRERGGGCIVFTSSIAGNLPRGIQEHSLHVVRLLLCQQSGSSSACPSRRCSAKRKYSCLWCGSGCCQHIYGQRDNCREYRCPAGVG